jgi:hypothetical protein
MIRGGRVGQGVGALDKLDTIQFGHLMVKQDGVKVLALQHGPRLCAIATGGDLVGEFFQRAPHQIEQAFIVVNAQNLHARCTLVGLMPRLRLYSADL